jgi:hypothetical protein
MFLFPPVRNDHRHLVLCLGSGSALYTHRCNHNHFTLRARKSFRKHLPCPVHTTMVPSHLRGAMNKPQKRAQPDDLTSVTYIEDDSSSSMFSLHAPVVREVPRTLLSSSSSSPYQNTVQNEVSESDSDSSSDDSSECSDSSDDFPQEDFEDEYDNSDKGDLDEASEIFSHANPSVTTSHAPPDENVDWKAAGSTESLEQQEAVLENMVRNLTSKLAEHRKKNERYVELFSTLDDTHSHIHSLNQRAEVLMASLSGRTSRTVPTAEPRPPLGDRQSVPNRSQHALTLVTAKDPTPVRIPTAAAPSPTHGEQQEMPQVANQASSAEAESPTRHVQSRQSNMSMVVALAGQASPRRRKLVRKVRRVPRKKTPEEFDLRSPCKEKREDDEAAFQVTVPEFVSPTSSKRSSNKRETVKNDIPKNIVLGIPFPAEELVAPATVTSPLAQDSNIDPVTPVPSSARRRPAMNHSANRVVAGANDRASKVLNKTSSVRSFFVKIEKVLSTRCMRGVENQNASPPVWMLTNPEMKAPLFEIGDSCTDDGDCSGRKSSESDLPLFG